MSEEVERSGHGVEVGDLTTVLVTDPNHDEDRDPVAEIGGVTTFLRMGEKDDPQFGEMVQVRIADIGERHIVAAAVQDDD